MTTIRVARMDKANRSGLYPVWGFREGDLLERLVVFFVERREAEDLMRLSKLSSLDDPLFVEVDDKAWAYVFTKEAA